MRISAAWGRKTGPVRRALVGLCLLAGLAVAEEMPEPPRSVRLTPVASGPLTAAAWDSLSLARATHLWVTDDLRGAVQLLETIDIGPESTFARNDRAAFLLGVGYLRLADRDAFLALTASVGEAGPYRRWLGYARLMLSGQAAGDLSDLPGADVLIAAHLLESGQTRAAAKLLDDGKPAPALAATHAYLTALAAADTAAARHLLEQIDPGPAEGPATRRAWLTAGQHLADAGDWTAAQNLFADATASLAGETAWIDSLEAQAAEAWTLWRDSLPREGEIRLPALDWTAAVDQIAGGALDLQADPDLETAVGVAVMADPADAPRASLAYARTHRPDREQWRRLDTIGAERGRAQAARRYTTRDLADLENERRLRLGYLETGSLQASERTGELGLALAGMDGLLANLDLALADLDSTRAAALRLFAERIAVLADELHTAVLYLEAVRHFHAEGPQSNQFDDWPAAVPRPADILDLEQQLATEVLLYLDLFGDRTPELVNRSCREVWAPRLAVDGPSLRLNLAAQHRRGTMLGGAIDSTAADLPIDREIAATRVRLAQQTAVVDSLAAAESNLKADVLREVAARGRLALTREREGLDYLKSNALYWAAVAAAPDPENQTELAAARTAREEARAALQAYLDVYPAGRARGESRYRLADLELLRARDDFQSRMAQFLGEKPSSDDLQNQELAPFVDYEPAIALYRAILDEDPDYAHVAAVLFQLGMILGDAGDPASAGYLETLVAEHPEAPFNQEAWLRLGDQHFANRDFQASEPCFTRAAAGADPSLQAVALYKLGWVHFEQDRFASAGDAFGRLLDLYVTGAVDAAAAESIRTRTDLEDEAREYLVHALIRSGGATAFADHFARAGARSYEPSILIAMGHELSRVSLYGEAIACDRMWLERFGDQDQALAVSERLVFSYRRWNKPDQARDTHLALAERFLPGSAWVTARQDTVLGPRSEEFAREAFVRAANEAHHRARRDEKPDDWREALAHYDRFLTTWPADATAARMQLQAGEAAHRLGQHAVALAHFTAASGHPSAAGDTTGLVREADWQIVAVTDDWYLESQGGAMGAADEDTLARRLMAAADRYMTRYPGSLHEPDLMWREGQLAYAHGWLDEAAVALAAFSTRYPEQERALAAVRMSGDAWYQLARYPAAGAAYQETLERARTAGNDSVAAVMAPLVPRCHYQHAQQIAAADTVQGPVQAAPLFVEVATRWPDFEHAGLALYRAGLGYAADGATDAAVAAWEQLLAAYPDSEYGRDSSLNIASAHETAGHDPEAAAALDRFSARYPADPDAAPALLRAGDLLAASGDLAGAEALRTSFLTRFPGETAAVMSIREERAFRALDSQAAPADITAYLAMAEAHPELASPVILARVDYDKAEKAHAAYAALALTQPLPAAIETKRRALENLLAMYAACAGRGVTEYTRAAAYRTGEAITHFGDALLASERPAELAGDDLLAYEEVLKEQSWPFYDRGEGTWLDLMKQSQSEQDDPGGWLQKTREELWPRVAERFMHLPEAEYPLVAATPPAVTAP